MQTSGQHSVPVAWPPGDGEMARRIRGHDWAATPLGSSAGWPGELRSLVELMLASPLVSSLACGPARILLYNDALVRLAGPEHLAALGCPLSGAWPDGWLVAGESYDRVFAGETLHVPARTPNPAGRAGAPEVFDAYLTPVRNADGVIVYAHMTGFGISERLRAEAKLRESEERQTFLLNLSDALHRLVDPIAIQQTAARLVGEHLGVERAAYGEVAGDDESITVARDWSRPGTPSTVGRFRFEDFGRVFTDPLRSGRVATIGDAAADPRIDPAMYARTWQAIGVRSAIASPLMKQGRFAAAFFIHYARPRAWTDAEIALVAAVADRTWDAVERARAEAALRESEAKYRTLFETMSQGYCEGEIVRDPAGRAADYRLLNPNPAFGRLIGTEPDQARGRAASEVIPGLKGWWVEMFDRVVSSGVREHVEREVPELGRWYEVRAYPEAGDRFVTLFDDITERKRAEIALQESETRQAFLLNLADAIQAPTSPAEALSTACRLLGEHLGASRAYYVEYDPEGDFGFVADEYMLPGLPGIRGRYPFEPFRTTFERISTGTAWVVGDVASAEDLQLSEREFYHSQGVMAWVNIPLAANGRFDASLCVVQAEARDWSRHEIELVKETAARLWATLLRARAEAALRESEERFRSFAENSRDVLWIVDAETRQLEYLSPSFAAMWGETRERVMGDLGRWLELVHPDDRMRASLAMPRTLAGETVTISYRIVRPYDGAERWIQDTGFPIRDGKGRITRVGGVSQDLTERTRTELEVRARRRELRVLVESIPQLVWRAVDGGDWVWASPQWTKFTGQREEDTHGWGWMEPIHPDDRDKAAAAWHDAQASGRLEVDYRLRRGDGPYRWFQSRATPVHDDGGNVVEWFGTSTDVDDIRRLQEHERVLLLELQHRVRNTLAVIRSIIRRTARTESDMESYVMHVEGRIDAFARVQASVTRDPTRGIDLEYLVAEELRAVGAKEKETATIKGSRILLAPKAAETLGLAVHELATNAMKYGALTVPKGEVAVRWTVLEEDGGPLLDLRWTETGMHLDGQPQRKGFGTMILTRTLGYELDAKADLSFLPTGVSYSIRIPLDQLRAGGPGADA